MSSRVGNPGVLAGVGIAAGVVQVCAGVAMYLDGVYFAPWSMLVSIVVLIVCILAGTRWYAATCLSGRATYGQALVAGIVISITTGVVYAVYNLVSVTFFYPHFLDQVALARIAQMDARELPHESFEVLRGNLTAMTIAIPNLVRLSVIGSLLSSLSALLQRTRA